MKSKIENRKFEIGLVIVLWLLLIVLALVCETCHAAADPNRTDMTTLNILAENWLEKVVVTQADKPYQSLRYRFPILRYPDGSWVTVYDPPKREINFNEFADMAGRWAGDPNYVPPQSGYYLCLKCKDKLYHVPYPNCAATKGYKMQSIPASDLKNYTPDPICLPAPKEPNLAELLEGVNDPNLRTAIEEMMRRNP